MSRSLRGGVTARHQVGKHHHERNERGNSMTRISCYITNSLLAWIAFVLVACFIVSTQNSTNAFWSVDLDSARDLEERRCFSIAQSGYDVNFGRADTKRESAEIYATLVYTEHSENDEEDADSVFARNMQIILETFDAAVVSAQSIADEAVSKCVDAGDRRQRERERERASRTGETSSGRTGRTGETTKR